MANKPVHWDHLNRTQRRQWQRESGLLPRNNMVGSSESQPTLINSAPDLREQKRKPRFGFSGFGFVVGIVMFAVQQGCSMTGNSPSWIWGLVWFAFATALLVSSVWYWDNVARHHWVRKLALSIVIVFVMSAFTYRPVMTQYSIEHAVKQPHVVVTENAPESKSAKLSWWTGPIPKDDGSPLAITYYALWRIHEDPLKVSLHDLFLTDFKDTTSRIGSHTRLMHNKTKVTTTVETEVVLDLEELSKMLLVYIPFAQDTYGLCVKLSEIYRGSLNHASSYGIAGHPRTGDSDINNDKQAKFSGRIFIYHDTDLSAEEIGRLTTAFRRNGAIVQFRGSDYLTHKMLQLRSGEIRP